MTRGHLVEFMYSTRVRIYDVQLLDSPFWNTHIYDCDDVHVRGVSIEAPGDSPNTDGWDPDSSRNVVIEDSSYSGASPRGYSTDGSRRCAATWKFGRGDAPVDSVETDERLRWR